MKTKRLFLCLVAWSLGGCCPLRGYKFASHGPGDTSAGDATHISEPGARVVVPIHPKKTAQAKPTAVYMMAFEKPRTDCVELEHKQGSAVSLWVCAYEAKDAEQASTAKP